MAPDDPDPKVKELLDAATRAELERWFGLPSYDQVEDKPVAPIEAEMQAVRDRRAAASAAVDPALREALYQRHEADPERVLQFRPGLALRVDPEIALFDYTMAEGKHAIAEPREVELSDDLRDDMKECAPQALLRDLHRPELVFDKVFELVDAAAEQRFDIVAEVRAAMATRWRLPALDQLPSLQARTMLADLRAERHQSWRDLPRRATLRNRRVVE